MVVRAFIMSISIMLWLIQLSKVASYLNPESKCNESCGDMQIPYPYGISKNCYYDKSFEIDCQKIEQIDGTPKFKPYLKIMDLEVFEIYDNTLGIYVPAFNSCKDAISGYDLRATPFSFSNSNIFAAFGCNILAYTTDHDYHVMAWCVTDDSNMCTCELRQSIKTFKLKVQSTINKTIIISNSSIDQKDVCGLGFLVDKRWNEHLLQYAMFTEIPVSDILDSWYDYMPVYLNWELHNMTAASYGVNNMTTSCISQPTWSQVNDVFYSNSSLQCFCRDGYNGDPYATQGCHVLEYPIWEPKRKVIRKLVVIGVSSAIGALILAFLLWWLYKKVKKEIDRRYKEKYFKRNGGLLLQQQVTSNDGNIEKTKIFSSYELEKATDYYNVDRVLGHGGQGTVYKGMLSDGKIIAVKKSTIIDTTKIGQFINEVVILSQINHRNIVKLLGCCLETEVPLLVYEFISNGTLFHHIQDPNEDFPLTWEMRLRISSEIAAALSYMHSAASLPIYHRDIKSTNILLDEKYKARVSDFGLSRSVEVDKTHFTTLVQGTFGYLDPEYFQSSQFTEKSDVYSFGVVLVELLTGKKPIFSNSLLEFRGLASHFIESMEQNQFLEMIDLLILKEDKIEEMVAVAHLAKICLNLMGRKRPTMKEVAVQLENIRMSKETMCSHDTCEATENFEIDMACDFDTSPMSTGTWSKTSTSSPTDVLPLLTYP